MTTPNIPPPPPPPPPFQPDAAAPTKKYKWVVPLIACGALFLLVVIAGIAGAGKKDKTATATTTVTTAVPTTTEAPTTTAAPTTTEAPTTTAAPTTTEAPTTTAAPAPAAPTETPSQQQAVESAQSYLDMGKGFSRTGLIEQLSSSAGEGFSVADATYAVDSLNVDWNAQAVLSAKGYMEMGGFSRASLIEQLESSAGEGFTHAQAVYAVGVVGL